MSDLNPYQPYEAGRAAPPGYQPTNLADVLDRVLDKGVVIAGDISISLVSVELLTIKIRLLVASVERAREMGIDWWSRDEALVGPARAVEAAREEEEEPLEELDAEELARRNRELRHRVDELEERLRGLLNQPESTAARRPSPISTPDLMKPEKTAGRRVTMTVEGSGRGADEEWNEGQDPTKEDHNGGERA
jgi:hypothetical protein